MADITIHGVEHIKSEDEPLFTASIARALRHSHGGDPGKKVTLYCNPRLKQPNSRAGWLEYSLTVAYPAGGTLYIGCIQRSVGADCEFRS